MKSYNHLFEICISEDNRRQAIKQAKRSKRIRKIIRKRHLSDDALLADSLNWILNYQSFEHTPIIIHDGIAQKQRTIIVPTLEELIVQHCVVNAMKPLLYKGMYEHSYASIPNRGSHKAKKLIEKWIRTDPKNTKYVLKMDIRHFFDSVPHDILKAKLAKKIHDDEFLSLVFNIIDTTEDGLPLGFYTSQWFSNWYLQELDHYIKEKLHAKYYVRYMDDMVVFGSNKRKLHQTRLGISEYLETNLGLELKYNWQVFRFSHIVIHNGVPDERGRDLDFMGFRFYCNRTTIRRTIMLKASRKAKKISKKEHLTIYDCHQMLSYIGWIDCTDSYGMYLIWIKPFVNFQQMKRYVSKHDKTDDVRVYMALVQIYTKIGGSKNGTSVHSC